MIFNCIIIVLLLAWRDRQNVEFILWQVIILYRTFVDYFEIQQWVTKLISFLSSLSSFTSLHINSLVSNKILAWIWIIWHQIFTFISWHVIKRLVNLYLPNLYIYRHSKCCPPAPARSKLLYEKVCQQDLPSRRSKTV